MALRGGVQFARAEASCPPGGNHAVKGAIVEALKCKEEGTRAPILFTCAHGHFDMQATSTTRRQAQGIDYDGQELAMALAGLPSVAEPA